MIIEQLSVFAENNPGKLEEVLKILAENQINIKALSVADTADFGIVRLVVDEAEKVRDIFKNAGFTARLTPVLAVMVEDKPGQLYSYVNRLSSAGINIEYTYAFTEPSTKESKVVIKVDDANAAEKALNA